MGAVIALPRALDRDCGPVSGMACLRGDAQTLLLLPGIVGAHVVGRLESAIGEAPTGGGAGVAAGDRKRAGAEGGAVIDSRCLRTELPLIVR